MKHTLYIGILICFVAATLAQDRVLLKDVTVLTLRDGEMTTGRRSSPQPQLVCLGGSAGCSSDVKPKSVQCKQVGWDGYDAQWECTADLDDSYRFGKVEVVCEGYDYPDDPYILRGSCNLEYTLDYTGAGKQRQNQNSYNYGYDGYHSRGSTFGGSIFSFVIFAVIVYAMYLLCVAGPAQQAAAGQGYPGGQGPYGGGPNGPGGGPGGPGGPGIPPGGGPGCNQGSYYAQPGYVYPQPHVGGGGFWNGVLTGGALGYLFGNRRYGGYGYGGYGGYGAPYGGYNRGGGFGGGMGGFGGGGFGGTRAATGFGGTRRR